MFLACGAQKENLMASNFSTSSNGNRELVIKPLFKKSDWANLLDTLFVSLGAWRGWKGLSLPSLL